MHVTRIDGGNYRHADYRQFASSSANAATYGRSPPTTMMRHVQCIVPAQAPSRPGLHTVADCLAGQCLTESESLLLIEMHGLPIPHLCVTRSALNHCASHGLLCYVLGVRRQHMTKYGWARRREIWLTSVEVRTCSGRIVVDEELTIAPNQRGVL